MEEQIEIKVFLKNSDKELKDVIGIDFERQQVLVKQFFSNGKRQKITGFYYFNDCYFKITSNNRTLTINKITSTNEVKA